MTHARTGKQYLSDLRDGRDVVVGGSRVADVTSHSALRGSANSIAALMDLHHDPDARDDLMTTCQETGETVPWSYALATDAAGVAARGRAFEIVARATAGLMGRSPDFLATLLASWYARSDFFGRRDPRFADNVRGYYRHARKLNLCHTHAISDPPRDRHLAGTGEPLTLRKVGETSEGIVVRGMKMLATLAPVADALLVYPFRPLGPDEAAQTLAFALPADAPGLRLLCRDPLARDAPLFDAPLSERFDEMDALCVFEDAVVPRDLVFIDGDVELANALRAETAMTTYQWHQTSVRAAVKAELLVGVAGLLARASGRDRQPPTRVMLGEMAAMVESLRALVTAAEATAAPGPGGRHLPATPPLGSSSVLASMFFPRFGEFLQLIGSSGLIMGPSERDLSGPAAELLRDYFTGDVLSPDEHAALLRLASELAVGAFGGRHLLYERFYLGPPDVLRERFLQMFDREKAEQYARGWLVLPGS
ncbi:4-hydroxyphenylacetate 3-monooxygenase [Actinomadura sp. KC216]|uniref:4-hydroxyphenylacetate 3-hydroxylase family protein n=1 Tax=Actinomadura sp. KC216 TaxID=2530370 RepID=UPI0010477880|nr:4-hydroxyphenylacetate 3-hydroxylase N-terminal domain-containing protein [Actinomadura sp. KC216]TDB90685.1 4-hydroxyphenylacetate 3-monooxygenase [Actinomadura sp. KC216]